MRKEDGRTENEDCIANYGINSSYISNNGVVIAIFVWILFFFACYIMSHADEHPILIKLIVRKDGLT